MPVSADVLSKQKQDKIMALNSRLKNNRKNRDADEEVPIKPFGKITDVSAKHASFSVANMKTLNKL